MSCRVVLVESVTGEKKLQTFSAGQVQVVKSNFVQAWWFAVLRRPDHGRPFKQTVRVILAREQAPE